MNEFTVYILKKFGRQTVLNLLAGAGLAVGAYFLGKAVVKTKKVEHELAELREYISSLVEEVNEE